VEDPEEALSAGRAALLGLIQGLTEFLPVSSSGHLALAEHMMGGRAENVAFDILLHGATLLVVLAALGGKFLQLARREPLVWRYLVVATIPTVLGGFLLKGPFTALRDVPTAICAGLLVTAGWLCAAEFLSRSVPEALNRLGNLGALIIGLCQCLALVPGISRSGMTIAGGMICGLRREDAFVFSFLLSVPAVGGALGLKCLDILRMEAEERASLFAQLPIASCAVGFVVAAASGFAGLLILRRAVAGNALGLFAAWCATVAVAGFLYFGLLQG